MNHIHSNTIEDVRTPGHHLSLEERGMIQALHRQGLSLRDIAAAVGCAHTTVFYKLRRGTPDRKSKHDCAPQYMVKLGQKAYAKNRKISRKSYKIDHDDCEPFIQWMVERVRQERWSLWMPALAMSGGISYLRRNRFPVPRHSTTCFGLTSFQYRSLRYRGPWGTNATANGYVRTSV